MWGTSNHHVRGDNDGRALHPQPDRRRRRGARVRADRGDCRREPRPRRRRSCSTTAKTSKLVVDTDRGAVRGTSDRRRPRVEGRSRSPRRPSGRCAGSAPEQHACWKDVVDTNAFGAPCPQLDGDTAIGSEDCLTLNVWRPDTGPKPRAVMVFVHGGGHVQGSTSQVTSGVTLYDGATLAAKGDVVVVTVQYRLGALGWLADDALGTSEAAGGELRPPRPDGGAALGADEHRQVRRRSEASAGVRRVGGRGRHLPARRQSARSRPVLAGADRERRVRRRRRDHGRAGRGQVPGRRRLHERARRRRVPARAPGRHRVAHRAQHGRTSRRSDVRSTVRTSTAASSPARPST